MYNLFYSYYDEYADNHKQYVGSFASIEDATLHFNKLQEKERFRNTLRVLDQPEFVEEFSGYTIEPIVFGVVRQEN